MTERPILMSAPMVRSILEGTKTQTRRALHVQPPEDHARLVVEPYCPTVVNRYGDELPGDEVFGVTTEDGAWGLRCPYGEPGTKLWVREAWAHDAESLEQCRAAFEDALGGIEYGPYYRATEIAPDTLKWRPSIHMPRWASRITLEVTGVRVERLQDISRGDAMAEGCPFPNMAKGPDPRLWYEDLWKSINGAGSWDANPFCWVIEFSRLLPVPVGEAA